MLAVVPATLEALISLHEREMSSGGELARSRDESECGDDDE